MDVAGAGILVPDLREKVYSLSPLSMMLSVGFSYIAFIVLGKFPPIFSFLLFL